MCVQKTLIFKGNGDNTKLENRRYMAEILPIKRKPLSNQSKKIGANPHVQVGQLIIIPLSE